MKFPETFTGIRMVENNRGIGLLEILVSAVLIVIFTSQILPWQLSSWKRTSGYNRVVAASRIIERQIEQRRIIINANPDIQYPRFRSMTDTTIRDSCVTPPITCDWHITPARNSSGDTLDNVCRVTIVAHYTTGDSLVVKTSISRNF